MRRTTDLVGRRVRSRTKDADSAPVQTRTYFTVEQSAEILRRYFALEFELFVAMAGAVPRFPELELKCEISHRAHTGMLRTRSLRERLSDFLMREPEKQPLPEWSDFARHVMAAPTPTALLDVIYRVVRPAQLRCYEYHATHTLAVNDAPTVELFDLHLPAMRADIEWGRKATAAASNDPTIIAFRNEVMAHLAALGGPWGLKPTGEFENHEYPMYRCPNEMALEARFTCLSADRYTQPDWPEYEAIPSAYTHFTELPVIDIVGTIVYDGRAYSLPFDYFAEFTRQLWDEARHCRMGFERLEAFGVDPYAVPIPVGHYAVWANVVLHRIASLTQVGEACSFAPKRAWVAAAWGRRDALSALEHEFDIVDERTHVMFGARWMQELMRVTNDARTAKEVIQDADWEFRERINALRKDKGENWVTPENLGERFRGCGTNTSPVSLAPALDGIPNIIA